MAKYIKLFSTHQQYEGYTADTTNFIKPNVSFCIDTPDEVHYNPLKCEETSVYEIIGTPTYPSTIDGDATSFDIEFDYERTDTDNRCRQTVTEGSDSVTVECGQNPSTSSTRTVSGSVDYHGAEIEYSVTQNKYVITLIGNFNVTSTTSPTRILSATTSIDRVTIDGVEQPSVTTGYTFSTTGDHTVKYYLKDTSIGGEAFYQCTSLESIDIPDSVTSIGDYAFSNCTSLSSCTIGSGVTSIGDNAFYSATSLTSIDIPDSVTSIGDGAFIYCSGLTSCTIGSGVTSIGNYVFYQCRGLESIDIPDSVTSIGNYTFQYCTSLTSCTIGSGVTSIGAQAFYNCTRLESIDIPSGVTSIGNRVFYECYRLTSIDIPDSVTSIGDYAFRECSSLESIDIPDSVTSIGSNAFESCTSLTSCTIGSGVTSIGNYAFTYCSGLTSIDIPDSVTSIGDYAFNYCYSLTSITSNAVTAPTIQSNTFRDVKTNGTLYVPIGSSGYDTWMQNSSYYLGVYNWTKVEQ